MPESNNFGVEDLVDVLYQIAHEKRTDWVALRQERDAFVRGDHSKPWDVGTYDEMQDSIIKAHDEYTAAYEEYRQAHRELIVSRLNNPS